MKQTNNSTAKKSSKKDTQKGTIISISGPVVKARNVPFAKINDIVYVGHEELLGEIIEIMGDISIIQVYEETDGLVPGESVINTKEPLSVTLGPGIMSMVYDGVQRPLDSIKKESGTFIKRGIHVPSLDETKTWEFNPVVKVGDTVNHGDVIGTVQETSLIVHKILVPKGVSGKVTSIKKTKATILDTIATIEKIPVTMAQKWPVKIPRPYAKRLQASVPLTTGQRVYDTFFPTVKGGQCAIPGPFGCGKTVTQQAIAKWCDAQVIVYVGCGERGNEMTEVLTEFPELKDPKSGKPLMDRTILIANTSNMPVAAREASVYTGITIAEYFRDQGYDVAMMADSTSRWAEAMREISGRLEEMPGEEGYPAYLANRLSSFYERAGRVTTLSKDTGSVTVIGAVSPPGGDFSEPVTLHTLRTTKVFWALDAKLAAKRHYWAIDWLSSYSLYTDNTDEWFNEQVSPSWGDCRKKLASILQQEASLLEIAQLVGKDSLPDSQQFLLLVGKIIREDFLQQNAFDEQDMFCPIQKQHAMAQAIVAFLDKGNTLIDKGKSCSFLEEHAIVKELSQMKYADNKKSTEVIQSILEKIERLS